MAKKSGHRGKDADRAGDGEPTRTARWARRRHEIIRTAEAVFAELGFGAATLEEVAARLELRRASLAYYFDDKEALFDSVFHEILLELRRRLTPAFETDDPAEAMEAIASDWVDFLQERPTAGRVLLRQMVDGLAPRSDATRESFFDLVELVRASIERGVEQGLFKALDAGQYGAMIAGTSLLWISSRETLQRGFGFDPLAPEQMENLRHRLIQLTRQLLETSGIESRTP
jgi:TetR/AcrR family transcriptional regulator